MEEDLITELSALNNAAYKAVKVLKNAVANAATVTDHISQAEAYHDDVIPAMNDLRDKVDRMETMTASEYWPLPTYGDMLFRV